MFFVRHFPQFSPLALGACVSLAAVGIGCSESGERPGTSSHDSAVQASDTSRAPATGESRIAMAFPTGVRSSSDLLVEQIGQGQARVGRPYTYRLLVTNLTDKQLTGITLRQRLPENFKLAENTSVQAGNDRQAQIQIGDLAPHQSKTIEVSGTATGPGTLDMCLSAQFNPPTLCVQIPIVAPAIRAIAEGPSQADVCQDLNYRYTVTNTGTGTARNVSLQANLPDGVQTVDGQRSIAINVGDLAQGQSKSVNARLRASQAGNFTSQAIVHSDDGDANVQAITTQVRAPRLAVTMTGPRENFLGQPMAYQVTVKNTGDAPAVRTRVRLGATPGSVRFVRAEGANGAQLASEREGGGQDLGTIAPGETRNVTVDFEPQREGSVAVDATAQANCAQPVTTSVNSEIRTITAAALIVTHDPDPVPVGGRVVYHITVQNKGTATDHDVNVTATIPESEEFVRASGQTEVKSTGRNVVFATIPTLAPKQTMTWQVEAKALRADEAQFQVSMTSQSTQKPAVKLEPTKLFGAETGTQTHTNEAPEPARNSSSAPVPQPGANK